MKHQFFFLSGLPRSGSTLLSAILEQNPSIHTEGNSSLCQMMWDLHSSIEGPSSEALKANRRLPHTQNEIVSALPDLYYSKVEKPIVFDKGRTWPMYSNLQVLKRYVSDAPKIVILVRPIDEVVKSFVKLRLNSDWQGDPYLDLLLPNTDPVCTAFNAVEFAKFIGGDEFLFVSYQSLVENPDLVVDAIYGHCGIEKYTHHFNCISQKYKEDDTVYGLNGMHDVRSTIGVEKNTVTLPENIQNMCDQMTECMFKNLNFI